MKDYELLIFDWEGTLSDSHAHFIKALQSSLAGLGLPSVSEEQIRQHVGLDIISLSRKLCPNLTLTQGEQLVSLYHQTLCSADNSPQFFKGIPDLLRDLNHKGKFVAVLTCKGREWLNKDLKSNPDVSSALFASVTPSECQAKPSPEGILHLLDQSGVEADKAVMIGDSLSDMMAAVNAGIDGIAVNFCHLGREEELLSAGANELFTSVEDLANRLLLK